MFKEVQKRPKCLKKSSRHSKFKKTKNSVVFQNQKPRYKVQFRFNVFPTIPPSKLVQFPHSKVVFLKKIRSKNNFLNFFFVFFVFFFTKQNFQKFNFFPSSQITKRKTKRKFPTPLPLRFVRRDKRKLKFWNKKEKKRRKFALWNGNEKNGKNWKIINLFWYLWVRERRRSGEEVWGSERERERE